jgi:hypothetical protein
MMAKTKRKCDMCRKSKRSVRLRFTDPDVYCCPACYRMLVKVTTPQPLS